MDASQSPLRLETASPAAVVELIGRDGRVQWVQRVTQWPVRLGRSPACDIVLDDPHVAAEHAELHWTPSGARLQLLGSRNGGSVGQTRLAPGQDAALPPEGGFHLAGSSLRLRTSVDALAPEALLLIQKARHWALLPVLLLVMLTVQALDRWSTLDPDARWIDYASPLLGPLAILLAWAGLWSLASQIFQHRFPFAAHLRRAVLVLVALQGLEWLLPLAAYAFSWPRLLVLDGLAVPVAGAALVAWHARQVWPGARRVLSGGIAALLLLGLGLQAGARQQQQYIFGPAYLASLPPPVFRVARPQPPADLIESLKPLKAELARQAHKDEESAEDDAE